MEKCIPIFTNNNAGYIRQSKITFRHRLGLGSIIISNSLASCNKFPWYWPGLTVQIENWQEFMFDNPWYWKVADRIFTFAETNYKYTSKTNHNLKILAKIPKYIQMDILEEYSIFNFFIYIICKFHFI